MVEHDGEEAVIFRLSDSDQPGSQAWLVWLDEEWAQRDPGCALVAVGQRMVLREPDCQDGRLVDEVGIELGLAESGGRRVQS
jgi:hypothetical protein